MATQNTTTVRICRECLRPDGEIKFYGLDRTCNRCRNARQAFLKSSPGEPHRTKQATPLGDRLLSRMSMNDRSCWLWEGSVNANGYGKIAYFPSANVRIWSTVHRIAAHVWKGLDLTARSVQVNHHCDNRLCFNPDHLYIGTQAENMADCKSRGRRADVSGERNPSAKLTSDIVREIRAAAVNAPRGTQSALARKYGVSSSLVAGVVKGERWQAE